MNYEAYALLNTVRNQDYFDACQEYRLGKRYEKEASEKEIEMADASSMFIRDEKRDDWKKIPAEKKKEIISEIMETAKQNENYLAMNILYQIMQDFEERIKALERSK